VINAFIYNAHPSRVIFGSGTVDQVTAEASKLNLKRALVLSTPQQNAVADEISTRLGSSAAGIFSGAVMHTPVDVTEAAMELIERDHIDGVVSVGGGSTIGLGKAIALRTDLPQIVIPTTYAGSEMTPILGETRDGAKTTLNDARILPEVVIYDVDLTMSLPIKMSVTSGINAIAHAVEALYAQNRNPVISMIAIESIRSLVAALPAISRNPSDLDARTSAQYGAWLGGICLGAVGMALHHKLCHVLGGSYDLPHAETHTVILPHALAYNSPAIPDVIKQLQKVLGSDPAHALHELAASLGAPMSLKELGMKATDVDKAVGRATQNPYWNPRSLERDALQGLISRAWSGAPPEP
jgi:maleylacetate reductase